MKWLNINNYVDKLILAKCQAQIWSFDLDQAVDKINIFKAILSSDELKRAGRFHFEIDKNRFICARGILRTLVCFQTGIKPSLIKFSLNGSGKPELEKELNSTSLKFNISHSRNILCIGMVYKADIGVDIEFLSPVPELIDLARNRFSATEFEQIMQLPEEYRHIGFYNCWTQKEAITKAIGEGLSFPIYEIEVSPAQEEKPIIIKVADKAGGLLHSVLVETFKINNHFAGAAAILDQVEKILYLQVDQYDDLISKFDNPLYT